MENVIDYTVVATSERRFQVKVRKIVKFICCQNFFWQFLFAKEFFASLPCRRPVSVAVVGSVADCFFKEKRFFKNSQKRLPRSRRIFSKITQKTTYSPKETLFPQKKKNKAVNKHLGNLGRSLISLDGMSCPPVIHEESFVNKWVDNISLFD